MRYEFITDGNYVDFFSGGALSCRLHKNSQAINWIFAEDNGIAFTVNGGYNFTNDATEIFFDGIPLTDNEDFVTAIQAMFPIYAGGGSGTPVLLSATVELTNAQILTLPSVPVQLVAAQGAGKAIIPISCIAMTNFAAGVYTSVTGASWQLVVDGTATIGSLFQAEVALQSTQTYACQIACTDFYTGAGDFAGSSTTYPTVSPTSYDNSGLYLADLFNGVDDYGGGNAANTLKVTVYYVVIDL